MDKRETLARALFERQAEAYASDSAMIELAWLDPGISGFWTAEAEFILETLGPAIDVEHIAHQRDWSCATFGPSDLRGPLGPLAHLRKELEEVADQPHDLEEWVDVLILAIDGAWRAGYEPEEILAAAKAKQAKNEARQWPDWRDVPADQAIEHVRGRVNAEGCCGDDCGQCLAAPGRGPRP